MTLPKLPHEVLGEQRSRKDPSIMSIKSKASKRQLPPIPGSKASSKKEIMIDLS